MQPRYVSLEDPYKAINTIAINTIPINTILAKLKKITLTARDKWDRYFKKYRQAKNTQEQLKINGYLRYLSDLKNITTKAINYTQLIWTTPKKQDFISCITADIAALKVQWKNLPLDFKETHSHFKLFKKDKCSSVDCEIVTTLLNNLLNTPSNPDIQKEIQQRNSNTRP